MEILFNEGDKMTLNTQDSKNVLIVTWLLPFKQKKEFYAY